jgi:hypothetical protein
MSTGSFLAALLMLLPAMSLAGASVPDTPAGHVFSAWLDAFNSGDGAREEAFNKAYGLGPGDDSEWRAETGGYDLLELYSRDKVNVFFRVKARSGVGEEIGRLRVNEAGSTAVEEFNTWRVPPGTTLAAAPLAAATRRKVVESVARTFETFYVYPETGKRMSAALRAHEKLGDYRSVRYGLDLARRLTEDLREVSHDKHAAVRFSFFVRPPELQTNDSEAERRQLAVNNCGFEKAEHLRSNIGYIKFNVFADPAVCGPTASAAINFVADSDALIVDLRDNHGGRRGAVEYVAAYFFDQRTRLSGSIDYAGNTQDSWTAPDVPGKRFVGKPVFILTSKQTFSAAESFCYSLKNLKRATLIGETTGGGAHPIDIKPIDDHFSAIVPFARSYSPITRTDWEGTGIEPDVRVPVDQAFDVALNRAEEEIRRKK